METLRDAAGTAGVAMFRHRHMVRPIRSNTRSDRAPSRRIGRVRSNPGMRGA